MYEDGQPVDSMVVVVGKPKYPTPMMTAYIRFAALNPYWYVPPDLASERSRPDSGQAGPQISRRARLSGPVRLDAERDRSSTPRRSTGKGSPTARSRSSSASCPGPHNSMGRMKFMFPNEAGVYLHDNPERELFSEASRLYSGGCVRLEDAPRLGRWLFGHALEREDAGTEAPVPLQSAGAGLHHLSDGDPGRLVDRLFRRCLRTRTARWPSSRAAQAPSPARAGSLRLPPIGEEGHVLGDGAARRISRRGEPHVAHGQLAHQCVDRAVPARPGDPAIRDIPVGIDADGHADASALQLRWRRSRRYSRSGIW